MNHKKMHGKVGRGQRRDGPKTRIEYFEFVMDRTYVVTCLSILVSGTCMTRMLIYV
jgi:hypothetical protein